MEGSTKNGCYVVLRLALQEDKIRDETIYLIRWNLLRSAVRDSRTAFWRIVSAISLHVMMLKTWNLNGVLGLISTWHLGRRCAML